ncbi:hypothetical protein [Armatimonas rosea]|uniref:Uncharacterized protein n=1 Tax=Armatimonas rosea TaxID=685828 RepID=A0A7W9ST48_ARMRO|nr:hypothetical protein [Armatimonas rosea]MBB6051464.1 hypothetical protein [Armatimonas rosea]
MQAQQQKPTKQNSSPKQRLSVGEVVVAILNLLIGAVGAWSAFDLLIHLGDSPIFLLPGSTGALGALGAILTGILVFLRQRRLAFATQWLGVAGALGFFAVTAWAMLKNGFRLSDFIYYILPLLIVALVFTWFAWFLKRIDESK